MTIIVRWSVIGSITFTSSAGPWLSLSAARSNRRSQVLRRRAVGLQFLANGI